MSDVTVSFACPMMFRFPFCEGFMEACDGDGDGDVQPLFSSLFDYLFVNIVCHLVSMPLPASLPSGAGEKVTGVGCSHFNFSFCITRQAETPIGAGLQNSGFACVVPLSRCLIRLRVDCGGLRVSTEGLDVRSLRCRCFNHLFLGLCEG